MTVKHPAKFSENLLTLLSELIEPEWMILDPFAGTGRVHLLSDRSWGVEIEPEWASMHPRTIVGDALRLPFRNATFDAVVTSPTYGNRLADHHEAKDGSVRHSYRHDLGRSLHPSNSGQLQWGPTYRDFHVAAWCEVHRVIKPGGRFLLNTSNHIRKGQIQEVNEWHFETIEALGFEQVMLLMVPTSRLRFGANSEVRIDGETISVWELKC